MNIVRFVKHDIVNVHDGLERLVNRSLPKWVGVIWYILLTPLGLVAMPFVMLWYYFKIKQLERTFRD